MILTTSRLQLRPYLPEDEAWFTALNCNPVARQHMNGALTPEQARQRFMACLSNEDAWAITESDGGACLGHVFIAPAGSGGDREIGFILEPAFWGRGFGSEATRAVVEYGVRKYGRVIATVDTDHAASIKVLNNAGMIFLAEEKDEHGPYLVYEACTSPETGGL